MTARRTRRLLPALVASGALATAATGSMTQQAGTVDLLTDANLTLTGDPATGMAGVSMAVADAGDVNGDGIHDVVVGMPYFTTAKGKTGAAFVLFGSRSPSNVNVTELPSAKGFRIVGALPDDRTGGAVAGVGDVNGDGRDDVAVGSFGANPSGGAVTGCVHVVFGAADGADVDLAAPGARAIRVDGVASHDDANSSVAGGGDLNADGIADLVVGSPNASPAGRSSAGRVDVIFGSRTLSSIDLTAGLGTRGVRIDGAAASNAAGTSVAGVGDVSGDGVADLAIGAPGTGAGRAYVVFGSRGLANRDLGALGTAGIRFDGETNGDSAGWSVAGGRDINGDGASDIVIGASQAAPAGRTKAGRVYVVHGGAGLTGGNLASLAAGRAWHIDGAAESDLAGWSVAAIPDMNGDGINDVAVGAPFSDPAGRPNAGRAYVVFGSAHPADVDLAAQGAGTGVTVNGSAASAVAASSVAGVDVNGDGRGDLVVSQAANADRSAAVVFGWGASGISYPAGTLSATAGTAVAPLTPTIRRTGPATATVSPALPPGLAIDASTGVISGTPTAAGTTTHVVTTTDLAGAASTNLAVAVAAAPAPVVAPPAPVRLVKAGTLRVVRGVAVLPVTALERGRYTFRFATTKGAPQRLQAGSRAIVGAGKRRRVVTLRRPANVLSVAVPTAGTRVRLEVRVRLPRVRTALRVELLRADRTRAGQVVTLRTPKAPQTRKARR